MIFRFLILNIKVELYFKKGYLRKGMIFRIEIKRIFINGME